MTALRRIGAIFLALILLVGAIFIAAQTRGWDWMFYFFVFAAGYILLSLVLQLILFIRLKRAGAGWYDFFYWFTSAISFGLTVYYAMIVRILGVAHVLGAEGNAAIGYHLFLLLPFVVQVGLIVCREIRVRRASP